MLLTVTATEGIWKKAWKVLSVEFLQNPSTHTNPTEEQASVSAPSPAHPSVRRPNSTTTLMTTISSNFSNNDQSLLAYLPKDGKLMAVESIRAEPLTQSIMQLC